MKVQNTPGFAQLGKQTPQSTTPDQSELERIANPASELHYIVRFTCLEFTSLCPITGQPDFAHLVIDYLPEDWIIESKSLKLFSNFYRNHEAFHEARTMEIGGRLVGALNPVWLRIGAYWYPRGRLPIDIFRQTGLPPSEIWVPPQDVPNYRGRG